MLNSFKLTNNVRPSLLINLNETKEQSVTLNIESHSEYLGQKLIALTAILTFIKI